MSKEQFFIVSLLLNSDVKEATCYFVLTFVGEGRVQQFVDYIADLESK